MRFKITTVEKVMRIYWVDADNEDAVEEQFDKGHYDGPHEEERLDLVEWTAEEEWAAEKAASEEQ